MTHRRDSGKPTLRDVARAAGVSTFSVSRALSGEDGVSEETRERVRLAAREVGYVANQLARSLKGNSSRSIGILAAGTANEYYATLIGAFDHTLRSAGYQSFLADTMVDGAHDAEREANLVSTMLEQRVAAVVATYSVAPHNLDLIAEWDIPLIFVDCVPPREYGHCHSVTCDNALASRQVGYHFAGHGYRNWVFVGYPDLWSTRRPREQGFVEAAEQMGAHVDVVEAGNNSASGFVAMSRYLSEHSAGTVDAIYCANTPLLQGTLRALREDGRRAGIDIGVIGFDEFQWAELVDPAVTVVDQRIPEISHKAAQMLLGRLRNGSWSTTDPGEPVVVPAMIVRQSCGCPAGRPITEVEFPPPQVASEPDGEELPMT